MGPSQIAEDLALGVSDVEGFDAERLLNDLRGAVAVVGVDRLFEQVNSFTPPSAYASRSGEVLASGTHEIVR